MKSQGGGRQENVPERVGRNPTGTDVGEARGSPTTLPPPAGALPFGRSRVWENAEPREVRPSREMGGTAASQKTGTGGRKQVGKEGAGCQPGRVGKVGEGPRPHSLGAESLGMKGEE